MDGPPIAGWNLGLRFGLEVVALGALAGAGWALGPGPLRWGTAAAVPLAAAVTWSTFNVPGDPSRSGRAPVEVDGPVRLGVELVVLAAGAGSLWYLGRPALAVGYAALVAGHYTTSLGRLRWLLAQ